VDGVKEAAIVGLNVLLNLHHDPHPWGDLWRAIAAEHPFRDAWWEDRNLLPLLERIKVPVYLGCDWQNVPLHLPHTFTAYERLTNCKHLQVAMIGPHGLAWSWESLHIEALAWFDHWLKGHRHSLWATLPLHLARGSGLANNRCLADSQRRCIMLMHFEPTEVSVRTKEKPVPGPI
jgi:hypothetical protein